MMSAQRRMRGVPPKGPKADAVKKLNKGGCVKMKTREDGIKKS